MYKNIHLEADVKLRSSSKDLILNTIYILYCHTNFYLLFFVIYCTDLFIKISFSKNKTFLSLLVENTGIFCLDYAFFKWTFPERPQTMICSPFYPYKDQQLFPNLLFLKNLTTSLLKLWLYHTDTQKSGIPSILMHAHYMWF